MTLRERIDSAPMSRYQWFVISLCFLLNLLDGYDVSALAFTATSVSAEFGLTGGELGFLLSAGLVGMGAGSMLLGPLGDLIGRRPMILLSVGLATAAMLLTGAAFLVLLLAMPESIQFLLVKQPKNALARTNKLAERFGQDQLGTLEGQTTRPAGSSSRVAEIFDATNRRPTLLLWAAFFSLMVAYYFVNSWTPALLETAGMSQDMSRTAGIMLALGGTVGALVYGTLTSRWGNRRVLVVYASLAAVCIAVFTTTTAVLAIALALGVVVGMLVQGTMAGLYTLAPTTYEARVRSTGVGWAITVGRVGAIVGASVTGLLLDAGWSVSQLYLAVAMFMVLCAFSVYQTKPGPGTWLGSAVVRAQERDAAAADAAAADAELSEARAGTPQ